MPGRSIGLSEDVQPAGWDGRYAPIADERVMIWQAVGGLLIALSAQQAALTWRINEFIL